MPRRSRPGRHRDRRSARAPGSSSVTAGPPPGAMTRMRQASSPQDWTASRSPATSQLNSVEKVRPKRPSGGGGGEDLASGGRAVDRASPDAEVGAAGAIDPHLVDERAGRVDRGAPDDVALFGDRPRAAARDAIAWTRDVVPSSDPTRTTPPNGPAANDSGARSMDRAARSPSSPRTSRWPVEGSLAVEDGIQPEPRRATQIGGRYHARSRAAAIRSVGGPAQALGTHGRTPAPSVVDAMNPTAPRAITPGPIQRSHRDSTMRLTSSGGNNSWREEGEAPMLAGGPYPGLITGPRRPSNRSRGVPGRLEAKAAGSMRASAPQGA